MNSRERFLAALACQPVDRPPVWVMRQAGRYLPEYRALKERYSFLEMVRTPELVREVTMQPLRRFALDAAIVFSDILIVPEAMGQPYHFRDQGGIGMDFPVRDAKAISELRTEGVAERLSYLGEGLKLLRAELCNTALLGFAGSPWTLATYMVQGGSAREFTALKHLYFSDPVLFEALLQKVTSAVVQLLRMQIEAGVDAVQIFDSWGAGCPAHLYDTLSLQWIRRIVAALPQGFPVILYAKGMGHHARQMLTTGCRGLSVDWTMDIARMRNELGDQVVLQGNLDPAILDLEPSIVRTETRRLLDSWQGKPGHIFNLGHGIMPTAKVECMAALVETVVG